VQWAERPSNKKTAVAAALKTCPKRSRRAPHYPNFADTATLELL